MAHNHMTHNHMTHNHMAFETVAVIKGYTNQIDLTCKTLL